MIRKLILDKYQIWFQNLPSSNDVFYTLFSTFAAERIVHTKEFVNLFYRRIHNEPQWISSSGDPMFAYEALLAVHDHLIKYNLWKDYCVYFWVFALDSLENQLFVCHDYVRQEEVYNYIQGKRLKGLSVENDAEYERLPKAYRKQYRKFLTLPYSHKCFYQSMSLEAVCEINVQNLQDVAVKMKEKRVAFWGTGRKTAVFLWAYKEQEGDINCIIDMNVGKHGQMIEGVEITAYEKVGICKWNFIVLFRRLL